MRAATVLSPTARINCYGVDATLRWKPLRRAIYHSFVARSEFIWARTSISQFINGTPIPDVINAPPIGLVKPFGFYVSADYQLGRRWFLGGRFDRSERGQCLPTNPPTFPTCTLLEPITPGGNFSRNALLQDTGGSCCSPTAQRVQPDSRAAAPQPRMAKASPPTNSSSNSSSPWAPTERTRSNMTRHCVTRTASVSVPFSRAESIFARKARTNMFKSTPPWPLSCSPSSPRRPRPRSTS